MSKSVAIVPSKTVEVADVFNPGGQPGVTYNPRTGRQLEETLRAYLKKPHEVLLLLGPTKSGKTVLTRSVIDKARLVLVEGTRVDNRIERFWSQAASQITLAASETEITGTETEHGRHVEAGVGIKIPGFKWIGAKLKGAQETRRSKKTEREVTHEIDPQEDTIKALLKTDRVLVIEDFHAITPEVQSRIVRSLKGPVYDGMRVVVIGIPHREHDVELAMKDMASRTKRLVF